MSVLCVRVHVIVSRSLFPVFCSVTMAHNMPFPPHVPRPHLNPHHPLNSFLTQYQQPYYVHNPVSYYHQRPRRYHQNFPQVNHRQNYRRQNPPPFFRPYKKNKKTQKNKNTKKTNKTQQPKQEQAPEQPVPYTPPVDPEEDNPDPYQRSTSSAEIDYPSTTTPTSSFREFLNNYVALCERKQWSYHDRMINLDKHLHGSPLLSYYKVLENFAQVNVKFNVILDHIATAVHMPQHLVNLYLETCVCYFCDLRRKVQDKIAIYRYKHEERGYYPNNVNDKFNKWDESSYDQRADASAPPRAGLPFPEEQDPPYDYLDSTTMQHLIFPSTPTTYTISQPLPTYAVPESHLVRPPPGYTAFIYEQPPDLNQMETHNQQPITSTSQA